GARCGRHATPAETSAPALARRHARPAGQPLSRRPGVQPGRPHYGYARRTIAAGGAVVWGGGPPPPPLSFTYTPRGGPPPHPPTTGASVQALPQTLGRGFCA